MPRYLSLLCKVHICHSQSLCILKVVFFFSYFCVCVSKQTAVNKLNVRTKTINLCFQVRNNGKKVPGADPRFFLGGAAPLSKQIVNFFWQNTICIRKQQVMSGERRCAPLHPPPRSAAKFLVQGYFPTIFLRDRLLRCQRRLSSCVLQYGSPWYVLVILGRKYWVEFPDAILKESWFVRNKLKDEPKTNSKGLSEANYRPPCGGEA